MNKYVTRASVAILCVWVLGACVDVEGDVLTLRDQCHTGACQKVRFGTNAADATCPQGVWDTYISQNFPDKNFGSDSLVHIASNDPVLGATTALLRFDLCGISAGVRVVHAAVILTTGSAGGSTGSFDLFAITEPWVEGDEIGGAGAVSWTMGTPTEPWAAPGCGPGTCVDAPIGQWQTPLEATTHQIEFDARAVQKWIDQPTSNFGLAMKPTSPGTDACSFVSSERNPDGVRPTLEVIFLPTK